MGKLPAVTSVSDAPGTDPDAAGPRHRLRRRSRRRGRGERTPDLQPAEFSPLTIEQMEEIVVLQMQEVQERLNEYNITVQLTDTARKWLAKAGYDPAFGARPLRRAIQKHVESPLSVELLSGKFKDGRTVLVDVDEEKNKIIFQTSEPVSKKKSKQHADA